MQDATNYPEILQDLKSNITDVANQEGVNDETARTIAHIVAETLRKSWGGMQIYICKGHEYELSHRDLEIWAEFTGRNHHDLCRKYDMSLQRLYRIIAVQRQQALKERQGDLFE